jgi:D-amino peptidase
MRAALSCCFVLATLIASMSSPGAQRPLKVYISADMEGITGVASADQLGPPGFEYQQARQWMTGDVLAAIQGARDAGATEFVVSDSHGNGESLLIDRFPNDVPITIVRSFPRPLGMMEGLDSSFAAAMFIGYHASTSSVSGVRAHTISSALLTRIAINGTSMSEAGINAAIAADLGVPVVMITGDDAIVGESRQRFGPIEGVAVKRAIGFHSAATMTPEAAQSAIRQHAKIAVDRRGEMRPYKMARPLSLEVSFKNYRPVELLGYLPGIERIDSHTVRYAARDMGDVSKFIEFVTNYDPALTP